MYTEKIEEVVAREVKLKSDLRHLAEEKHKYESEVRTLENQMKAINADKDREISELRRAIEISQNRVEEYRAKSDKLSIDISEYRALEIVEIERRHRTTVEISTLEGVEELSDLRAQLTAAHSEIEKKKIEVDRLKEDLDQCKVLAEEHQAAMEHLNADLCQLTEEKCKYESEVSTLEGQMKAINTNKDREISELRHAIELSQRLVEEYQTKSEKLSIDISEFRALEIVATERRHRTTVEISTLEGVEELNYLRARLAEAHTEIERKKVEVDRLKEDLDQCKVLAEEHQRALEQLNADYETPSVSCRHSEDELRLSRDAEMENLRQKHLEAIKMLKSEKETEMRERDDVLLAEIKRRSSEIEELTHALDQYKVLAEQHQEAMEKLNSDFEAAKLELNELHLSYKQNQEELQILRSIERNETDAMLSYQRYLEMVNEKDAEIEELRGNFEEMEHELEQMRNKVEISRNFDCNTFINPADLHLSLDNDDDDNDDNDGSDNEMLDSDRNLLQTMAQPVTRLSVGLHDDELLRLKEDLGRRDLIISTLLEEFSRFTRSEIVLTHEEYEVETLRVKIRSILNQIITSQESDSVRSGRVSGCEGASAMKLQEMEKEIQRLRAQQRDNIKEELDAQRSQFEQLKQVCT